MLRRSPWLADYFMFDAATHRPGQLPDAASFQMQPVLDPKHRMTGLQLKKAARAAMRRQREQTRRFWNVVEG